MREKYAVAHDQLKHAFMVTKPDGTVLMFNESASGPHYLDSEAGYCMTLVNTIASNGSSYTNEDYIHAVQARELQVKIG